ncbi:MAG: Hsp33 family molecular chaperone HslO [Thermoanaerobaculia bacterium]
MDQDDRLIQGMAGEGDFRVIAAMTAGAAEEARRRLDLSPVAAAAAARAMTGAVLLARLLDKDLSTQRVTLRFEGGGPLGLLVAEGTVLGEVRVYVSNPHVDDEARLDVGAAVGSKGKLTVVRAMPPTGAPYTSQVALVNGEIGRDLAHYLAHSEQIPTAVMLGQVMRPAGVAAAGGIVVQAFPHTSRARIEALEKRISEAPRLSTLLGRMPIEEAVGEVLTGFGFQRLDRSHDIPVRFACSCTREKAAGQFRFLDREDLHELIAKDEGGEVVCQFCGEKYRFSTGELLAMAPPPDA